MIYPQHYSEVRSGNVVSCPEWLVSSVGSPSPSPVSEYHISLSHVGVRAVISELDCFLSVLTPSVPLLCRLVIKQGWLTSYKARLAHWLRFSVSRCQIRNSCKFMEIFNEVCFVNSHPLKTNIPEENLFQLTSSHLGQMLPSFVLTAGSR